LTTTTGLHHVAFVTRDPEATRKFYVDKLGMPLVHVENHLSGDGWFRHFFFDMGGGASLGFFELNGVGEKEDYATDLSSTLGLPPWANHVAFRVENEQRLLELKQRFEGNGVEPLVEFDHGWCRSIYTVDPSGIAVEFCATTKAEGFAMSEEEALRLLRQPPEEFFEGSRKEQRKQPDK